MAQVKRHSPYKTATSINNSATTERNMAELNYKPVGLSHGA